MLIDSDAESAQPSKPLAAKNCKKDRRGVVVI
jgi:hypothetical protein